MGVTRLKNVRRTLRGGWWRTSQVTPGNISTYLAPSNSLYPSETLYPKG